MNTLKNFYLKTKVAWYNIDIIAVITIKIPPKRGILFCQSVI